MNRAMADDADVGLRNAEEAGDVGPGFFIIEGHDDNGALTFAQPLDTAGKLFAVQMKRGVLDRGRELCAESRKQALLALCAAAQVENSHAAGAKDKGGKFFRLAQAPFAEGEKDGDKNLLGKVVGGVRVAKMAEAVEATRGAMRRNSSASA